MRPQPKVKTSRNRANPKTSKKKDNTKMIKIEKEKKMASTSSSASLSDRMIKIEKDKKIASTSSSLSLSDRRPPKAVRTVRRAMASASAADNCFFLLLLRVEVSRGMGHAITGRQLRAKWWRLAQTR